MMLSSPLKRLNDLVDWFLPADVHGDRDARQQARMFLFSHLFGPFIRMGFVVLGLFLLTRAVSAVSSAVSAPRLDGLPPAALQGLGIVSTIGTCLYVVMMALYYAKILAAGSELEGEVRRHLATA